MTTFHFPKEFGDRSDVGLGKLRALEGVDVPFMKSNPDGDTVAVKGNGFNTVTKRPTVGAALGRYICEGRFAASSGSSTVTLANGLHTKAFRVLQIATAFVLGQLFTGLFTLGAKRSLLATTLSGGGTLRIYRVPKFGTQFLEVETSVAPASTIFYASVGHSAYYKSKTGTIEYETVVLSQYFGSNVLPVVIYSNAGIWRYAFIQGYDGYDHFTLFSAQIRPNLQLIAHAVVPRGPIFPLGARAATPNGKIPYPLFQLSTDCGRTYFPIDVDYLFAGSNYEYEYPRVHGTGTAGLGGYNAIFSLQCQCLPQNIFISLEVQVDTASSASIVRGNYNFECRIFRSTGLDFTAMTKLNNPPGYGTTWTGALIAAFTESSPASPPKAFGKAGSGFGSIGYMANAVDQNTPNILFVSFDQGATWEPPRYLPAIGRWCGYVQPISNRELTCSVYEPTTPPQVVRFASTDFGLTWQRRQVIAQGVIDITTTGLLNDFSGVLAIDQDDGSLPTATPMSGWRYDSRIPLWIVNPAKS